MPTLRCGSPGKCRKPDGDGASAAAACRATIGGYPRWPDDEPRRWGNDRQGHGRSGADQRAVRDDKRDTPVTVDPRHHERKPAKANPQDDDRPGVDLERDGVRDDRAGDKE